MAGWESLEMSYIQHIDYMLVFFFLFESLMHWETP